MGSRNGMMNLRFGYMRLELGLEEESQQWSYKSDRTHVEVMKNPV